MAKNTKPIKWISDKWPQKKIKIDKIKIKIDPLPTSRIHSHPLSIQTTTYFIWPHMFKWISHTWQKTQSLFNESVINDQKKKLTATLPTDGIHPHPLSIRGVIFTPCLHPLFREWTLFFSCVFVSSFCAYMLGWISTRVRTYSFARGIFLLFVWLISLWLKIYVS